MTNFLHDGDLPDDLSFGASVAIDSETMGLRLGRDPLCVVQLSAGNGDAHVVQLHRPTYDAPNLKRLLADPDVLKIFHFGRFDIAMIALHLGVTSRAGLLHQDRLQARPHLHRPARLEGPHARIAFGGNVQGAAASSDWGATGLSMDQVNYAASDVLYLHALKDRLDGMLAREGRAELAQACFDFLPWRAKLDLAGWEDVDVFAHS